MPSIEQLRAMLDKQPGDAFLLYGLAQEYAKAREHARAVEHYRLCLVSDPAYCYAYFHMARSQMEMGDDAGAIGSLREGAEAARRAGDEKARGEILALLDTIE